MSGDYSRFRFDPEDDYAGVFMQQGRVQLDADWNALVDIIDRRLRAQSVDITQRCVVSRQTPAAFLVGLQGGRMTIGAGRMYVDGLLVENHGEGEREYDDVLGEMRGRDLDFTRQPYASASRLPVDSPANFLVYLDAWRREVTWAEAPDGLVDEAVGVDTTTRSQTAWRVRLIEVDDAVTCDTPLSKIPQWARLTAPSTGRLSTRTVMPDDAEDPCFASPEGGFRGPENRLYRFEIHQPGGAKHATFKWSRDNASIVARVRGLQALGGEDAGRTRLAVDGTGRDAYLRFEPGDWVEVTDDAHELRGEPGTLCRVVEVDFPGESLVVDGSVADEFAGEDGSHSRRNTRIRKWNQRGKVRDADGNEVADVDASGGAIPVAAASGWIAIEDGVQVRFSGADAGDGWYHSGDFWAVAARTATGSVEALDRAPPRGILHHHCRLAMVRFKPEAVTDCRPVWSPRTPAPDGDAGTGECACDVCVSAEMHNSGTFTLQRAVDQVKVSGGRICLGAGAFRLDKTLAIQGARSLRLQGKGVQTVLLTAADPAIHVGDSTDVRLRDFTVVTFADDARVSAAYAALTEDGIGVADLVTEDFTAEAIAHPTHGFGTEPGGTGIVFDNAVRASLRDASVVQSHASRSAAPAIRCEGLVGPLTVRDCVLVAGAGIASGDVVLTSDLVVVSNQMLCPTAGIRFTGLSLHAGRNQVKANTMIGCRDGAMVATGVVARGLGTLDISDNVMLVTGPGIEIATSDTCIQGNGIFALGSAPGHGIALSEGPFPGPVRRCRIIGNRVREVGGDGIRIRHAAESLMIKQNIIERTGGGGIVMEPGKASASALSIENNHLHEVARAVTGTPAAFGIALFQASEATVAANTVRGVGTRIEGQKACTGLRLLLCPSARICGNEIGDIGPEAGLEGYAAGIDILGPFHRMSITDNAVSPSPGPKETRWVALRADGTGDLAWLPDVAVILVSDRLGRFEYLVGEAAVTVLAPRGETTVRGNALESRGEGPAAQLAAQGPCVFSENQCRAGDSGKDPAVRLTAPALVVSSNTVRGGRRPVAMELRLEGAGRKRPVTVIANVVDAPIVLDGDALPPPWLELNAIA